MGWSFLDVSAEMGDAGFESGDGLGVGHDLDLAEVAQPSCSSRPRLVEDLAVIAPCLDDLNRASASVLVDVAADALAGAIEALALNADAAARRPR